MTLSEAIKSKLPFKRPCWSAVITLTDQDLFEIRDFTETKIVAALELYPNDLMADDYMLLNTVNINIINRNL